MSGLRRQALVILLLSLPALMALTLSWGRGRILFSKEDGCREGPEVKEGGSADAARPVSCCLCDATPVEESATRPESWGELLDRYAYIFQVPVSAFRRQT
jgi:hypothetical protein